MALFGPNRHNTGAAHFDGPYVRGLKRDRLDNTRPLTVSASEVRQGDEMLFMDRYWRVTAVEPSFDGQTVVWLGDCDVLLRDEFQVSVRRGLTP
jgi:hypothetical protein